MRQAAAQRLASVWTRARSLKNIQIGSAEIAEIELLLHCCEVATGLDVYHALPSGAKRAVDAPEVTWSGLLANDV